MTKVFIGGSRKIAQLSPEVRERLDRIMENEFPVLIGDANGADRAVQEYLSERGYDKVQVFCMNGICRNNIGNWSTKIIFAPSGAKGSKYYSIKDEEMTNESSIGLMLWDGQSKGTLSNIARLLDQGKKVVTYVAPQRGFVTLTNRMGLKSFLSQSKEPAKRGQLSFREKHASE